MSERVITPAAVRPHLVLDCGVDEQPAGRCFSLDERGMIFRSRWQFALGTQLAVACEFGRRSVRLEGIVVWCEWHLHLPDECPAFETTILFLDLPDDLKQSLREFSHQLPSGG